MKFRLNCVACLAALIAGLAAGPAPAADEGPDVAAIRAATDALVKDFNAGKVDAVVACFLPRGELIDEAGNIHRGAEELRKLFTQHFAAFPGAKLDVQSESLRVLGGLAIEEGTHLISAQDAAQARTRYSTTWAKSDDKWLIASTRESFDEPAPTPGQQLEPLDWLVGEWVSEDDEAAVKISYRWDEGKNFLLGEFQSIQDGQPLMKSTQRIGWDPAAGKVRSWLFDADGGFAEGSWTLVEDGWIIKSSATLPAGTTGTATVSILPKGRNQFTIQGTDRIVGDQREGDFEVTVTRAPPATKTQAGGATPAPAPRSPAVPQP